MTEENNIFTVKWPSLIAKTETFLFFKEKSLVGLTPGVDPTKLCFDVKLIFFRPFLPFSLIIYKCICTIFLYYKHSSLTQNKVRKDCLPEFSKFL